MPLGRPFAPLVLGSASRTPAFKPHEMVMAERGIVSVSSANEALGDGRIYVTDRRLVIVPSTGTGYEIELQHISIDACKDEYSFFTKSNKFSVIFNEGKYIFVFSDSNIKAEIFNACKDSIRKKCWKSDPTEAPGTRTATNIIPEKKEFNEVDQVIASLTTTTGIGGIQKRDQEKLKSIEDLKNNALGDMTSLMNEAKEVVKFVQLYAKYLNDDTNNAASEDAADEVNQMNEILQSIGLVSPVTKFSAGKLFHQELARQIAEILLSDSRLRRMGGMITLADAYCLINRARGTELISPNDLLQASKLMESLQTGISFKEYTTGVYTLQLDSMNEEYICSSLVQLLNDSCYDDSGLNAAIVADAIHVSLIVSKQQLLLAERKGLLCRDESIQGINFFKNILK